ncbi:hypothetical protein HGM15179_000880 [Zosterops borbonicus]|uniref:Uncharacterized protein n=1 Tax=Zosterops borbonicus TaxID=364589 RepID=A0A8K1LUN0_9PASS|nr:hypothetical protein HGM15179_000880 [Zosterops borbonicus]
MTYDHDWSWDHKAAMKHMDITVSDFCQSKVSSQERQDKEVLYSSNELCCPPLDLVNVFPVLVTPELDGPSKVMHLPTQQKGRMVVFKYDEHLVELLRACLAQGAAHKAACCLPQLKTCGEAAT